ncbi:MAG TPA: hypothetical protein VHO26_07535 [Propionibacteriaceae bacterium]|nr:hypothetical protein [Propionibacteriaceae bacterium]
MAGNDTRMMDMQLGFSALVLVFGLATVVLAAFRTISVDGLRCGHALALAVHGITERPAEPDGWAAACNSAARQAVLSPALMTIAALVWFGYALSRTLRSNRGGAQADAASSTPR